MKERAKVEKLFRASGINNSLLNYKSGVRSPSIGERAAQTAVSVFPELFYASQDFSHTPQGKRARVFYDRLMRPFVNYSRATLAFL